MRISLTSGISRKQIAVDIGIGMTTLKKWIMAHGDTDVVSNEDRELALEIDQFVPSWVLSKHLKPKMLR